MSHFAKLIDLPLYGHCIAFPHAHFADRFSVLTFDGFEEFEKDVVEAFGIDIPASGFQAVLAEVVVSPEVIGGLECLVIEVPDHGVLNSNDLRFYRRCDVSSNLAHRIQRQVDLTIHM